MGELFERPRTGNKCELGCVTRNVSSTSPSGGPGGRAEGLSLGGNTSFGSLLSPEDIFLDDNRRLLWVGCVQSSTSSI